MSKEDVGLLAATVILLAAVGVLLWLFPNSDPMVVAGGFLAGRKL